MAEACLKHSNLFKVKDLTRRPSQHNQVSKDNSKKTDGQHPALTRVTTAGQACHIRNPTTSFLTAATLIYAIGAGITAAAGTRLALQWILVKGFKLYSFQLPDLKGPALLFFVTTSLCQDWVICAPAAFLGCGSNLSGSLSGIEP
jgi:hypothetical protein